MDLHNCNPTFNKAMKRRRFVPANLDLQILTLFTQCSSLIMLISRRELSLSVL